MSKKKKKMNKKKIQKTKNKKTNKNKTTQKQTERDDSLQAIRWNGGRGLAKDGIQEEGGVLASRHLRISFLGSSGPRKPPCTGSFGFRKDIPHLRLEVEFCHAEQEQKEAGGESLDLRGLFTVLLRFPRVTEPFQGCHQVPETLGEVEEVQDSRMRGNRAAEHG